ncbi:hypothetical protein [Methanobacterium sp. MBAC-LM]|uniref:hypothetical protein n=1 Tax=Methanobacterium sp. MBAC-LM TaxID=3412034 RepID=UPI003C73C613
MDLIYWIGGLASVITIIGAILEAWKKIPSKYIKIAKYYILNKKVKVKFKSVKHYPSLNSNSINTKELKTILKSKLNRDQIELEGHQLYGKNYIQLLVKDSQAPYFISFQPLVTYEGDEVIEEGTEIKIELKGTIEFVYREEVDNKEYLELVENLFEIIEEKYDIKPSFKDYQFRSTLSDFNEKWENVKTKEKNGAKISIGEKVLAIDSTRFTPIYRLYKENITLI